MSCELCAAAQHNRYRLSPHTLWPNAYDVRVRASTSSSSYSHSSSWLRSSCRCCCPSAEQNCVRLRTRAKSSEINFFFACFVRTHAIFVLTKSWARTHGISPKKKNRQKNKYLPVNGHRREQYHIHVFVSHNFLQKKYLWSKWHHLHLKWIVFIWVVDVPHNAGVVEWTRYAGHAINENSRCGRSRSRHNRTESQIARMRNSLPGGCRNMHEIPAEIVSDGSIAVFFVSRAR